MCVFDGAKLPGKIVNHSRTVRVTRCRVMLEALRAGQSEHIMTPEEQKATEIRYLKQCTLVKEDMIVAVINELERAGLKWRRAPFEADAEIAHLMQPGSDALPGISLYDAVISADLDLVVHGVAALLTSYDVKNDSAFVYEHSRFAAYDLADGTDPFMEAVARKLKDPQWTVKQVLVAYACISGCDYIKNVKNIGHVHACKILETVDVPGPQALFRALQCYAKSLDLRPQHLEELRKAWHCWFSPWVTQISLVPGSLLLNYDFIPLSTYTDMPSADVLSVV